MDKINVEVFAKSFQHTFGIMNADRVKDVLVRFHKGGDITDCDEGIVLDAYFMLAEYVKATNETN